MAKKKISKLQKKKNDSNSRYWKKKADSLASLICRKKRGKCELCGSTENLNCHHLIDRTRVNLRFDPTNLICLCSNCHKWSREKSAHGQPLPFYDWFFKNFPERAKYLIENFGKPIDFTFQSKFEELDKEFSQL